MRRAKPAPRWCRRQARHKAPIFPGGENRQAVLGGPSCRSARPHMATKTKPKSLEAWYDERYTVRRVCTSRRDSARSVLAGGGARDLLGGVPRAVPWQQGLLRTFLAESRGRPRPECRSAKAAAFPGERGDASSRYERARRHAKVIRAWRAAGVRGRNAGRRSRPHHQGNAGTCPHGMNGHGATRR